MLFAALSALVVSVVIADTAGDSQTLHQRSEEHIYIQCNDILECHKNVPQTARSYFGLVHLTQQLMCEALMYIGNYGAIQYCELENLALEYQRQQQQGRADIEECYFTYRSGYNSDSSEDTDEDKVRRIFLSNKDNITSALRDCAPVVGYGCSLLRYGYTTAKGWTLLCLFVNEAMVIMDD